MHILALIDEIDRLVMDKAAPNAFKNPLARLRETAETMEARLHSLQAAAKSHVSSKKYEKLQVENERLETLLKQVRGDLEKMEFDARKKKAHKDRPEPEERILLYLAELGSEASTNEIAAAIGISRQKAMLHTTALHGVPPLIDGRKAENGAVYWRLRQNGREYLDERGKLK